MGDEAEFSGKSVDDAIAQAEAELGLPRGQLEIEVIKPGSRGVFGFGAEEARISALPKGAADVRAERAEEEAEEQELGGAEVEEFEELERELEPELEPEPVAEVEPERTPEEAAELAREGTRVLKELLVAMGVDADAEIRTEEAPITLAITGENLGILIGRRGDNLAALQFMVNLILSKNRRHWPRLVVDVENYRARREESLRSLADRVAYRVRRQHQPFTLEAMPANDRRIIHLSLRDYEDIETYSIGEGTARRVVIAPRRPARAS